MNWGTAIAVGLLIMTLMPEAGRPIRQCIGTLFSVSAVFGAIVVVISALLLVAGIIK